MIELARPGRRLGASFVNVWIFMMPLILIELSGTEVLPYILVVYSFGAPLLPIFFPESLGKNMFGLMVLEEDDSRLLFRKRVMRGLLPLLFLNILVLPHFPENFYPTVLNKLSPIVMLGFVLNNIYIIFSPQCKSLIDFFMKVKVVKLTKHNKL
ncbi:hypothetical protein MLD52_07790 [Puniceicoccaceae bacterium K14]|nr:hypothetical protein [Puniceicoccaceae bacterium K14]